MMSSLDCMYVPGSPASATNVRLHGGDELQAVMEAHQLRDIWRSERPVERAFNHSCATTNSSGRLDRWLLSESLFERLTAFCAILPSAGITSHHLPVTLTLLADKDPPPRGAGVKGFSLLLLNMRQQTRRFVVWHTQALMSPGDEEIIQRWNDTKARISIETRCVFRDHRKQRLQAARSADHGAALAKRHLLRARSAAAFPGFCWPPSSSSCHLAARPCIGLALQHKL